MKKILFILINIIFINLYGQSFKCFTDEYHESQYSSNIQYRNHYDSIQNYLDGYISNFAFQSRNNYSIPIVIHIITPPGTSIGSGNNLNDKEIMIGLNYLNDAFSNSGLFQNPKGVNTNISFCLAKKTPDNKITNGIERIESSLVDNSFCFDKSTDYDDDQEIKKLSNWDCKNYLNIWLVTDLYSNFFDCGLAGYATFPGANCGYDGIVVESRYWNDKSNSYIIAHEVGHYLNLLHTFTDGCLNNDCTKNGDKICDTPPDNSQSFADCNVNSCNTDSPDLVDDHSNYMDYSICLPHHFTNDQKTRMIASLELLRSSLINSDRCENFVENDVELQDINLIVCPLKVCPKITIKNNGTNNVSNLKIEYFINNSNINTFNWSGLLKPNDIITLSLNCINAVKGINTLNCSIKLVNNLMDNYINNNSIIKQVTVNDLSANFEIVNLSLYKRKFNNLSIGGKSYFWDFGDGVTSNEESPTHTYISFGNYKVLLVVTSDCGENKEFSYIVSINECSNGWRGFVLDQFSQEPDEKICDFISNGVLRIPPNLSTKAIFYTKFQLCDTICVGDEFDARFRLKNDKNSGGISAYDVSIFLTTESQPIGVVMIGESWGLPYSSIYVGNNVRTNLQELLFDFSNWNIIDIKLAKDTLYFSSNNSSFYKFPFDGSICNITGIGIQFKGSGSVDWINIFDRNSNLVYEENFDNCNKQTFSSVCKNKIPKLELEKVINCNKTTYKISNKINLNFRLKYILNSTISHNIYDSIFTNLPIGKYDVHVISNCSSIDTTFNIEFFEPLSDSIIFIEPKTCRGNGLIEIFAKGGIKPYKYNINNGNFTNQNKFSNLIPGKYIIKIIDSIGCVIQKNIEIIDNSQNFKLLIDSSKLTNDCNDSLNFISVKSLGNSLYYHYSIDGLPFQNYGYYKNLKPGKHFIISMDDYGCYSDTLFFTINFSNSFYIKNLELTICEGKPIEINNKVYYKKGIYIDTLVSNINCDTILNINIIEDTYKSILLTFEKCKGEIVTYNNKSYKDFGTYQDTISSKTTCDTIVKLVINEKNNININKEFKICDGDILKFNNKEYLESGIYYDTIKNTKTCDTIFKLNIEKIHHTFSNVNLNFCKGEYFEHKGIKYFNNILIIDTLENASKCDSIINYTINFNENTSYFQEYIICDGDSLKIGNKIYVKYGIFKDTIQNSLGCDSLITLSLKKGNLNFCDSINCRFYVPNVFTPNGDNLNDQFEIFSDLTTITEMSIFDRWGNLLFFDKSINPRWDGKVKGVDAGLEVYVYMIKGYCKNGKEFFKSGDITLIR